MYFICLYKLVKNKYKGLILMFYLILGCTLKVYSQYQMVNYTVDDGLPSSNVYSTFQDSKGFIWVCTDKGLARFDGYSFEVFTVKDGLPYNDVWGVQEDLDGNIWLMSYASHFTHFSYVDNKFHVLENSYFDASSKIINSFYINNKKEIHALISNSNYIFKIVNNKRIEKIILKSNNKNRINTIINYPISGYPLVNVFTLKNNITSLYIDSFGKKDFNFSFIRNFEDNSLIFKWNSFVFNLNEKDFYFINYLNKKTFKIPLIKFGLNNKSEVLNKVFYSTKVLSFVTSKNIIQFDLNLNYKIISNYPIKSNIINNINSFNDSFDFVSTKGQGLYKILKKNILYKNNIVNSISTLEYDNEYLLIGYNNGEFSFHENKSLLNFNKSINNISTRPVKVFKKISKWNYLISWYGSPMIIKYKNKSLEINKKITNKLLVHHKEKINIKKTFIFKNFLINTNYNSISKINLNNFKYEYLSIGFRRFNSAIADTNDIIWLASSSGLSKVLTDSTTDELISLKQKFPILSRSILDMQPDNQNRIWCGTDGFGLYAFKNNGVNVIEELKNEIINQVHIDYRQHVWVSTNKGGFRIILEKEFPFTYQIKKFSIAQGLPTNEVNCIFADSNFAYFGTQKGLGVVDLTSNNSKHAPAPFYIKQIITVNDTFLKGPIVLPYNKSRLEFDFVCLSFKSNKNIVYYYKMQGIDSVWRTTDQLKIIYPILPPGKYTFFIKAKDIDDVFTAIRTVDIEITPPFWDTLWFKLSVTFALFFSGLLYLAYRIRAIKLKERENTIVNKKIAELELQALQSQMNPHFMFNSLNAIQNFILNRTSDDASSYLGKFSKLMRLFLESSRNKYITIAEEIDLIQLYIDMELIRYNNKFTAEIICENNQLYNQEIPSMLIQPFVENAINHGLILKKEGGHLLVKFWNDEEKIYMMVDDDGIGRDKAMEIKKKSIQGYVSRALEITNDRLETMNTLEDLKLKIEIIDKTDDEGNSTGTRIMIELNNLD